jgi:membrane protease YdiL (CAAX protease family)
MTQSTEQTDWRFAHGVAFILLMACALAVPVLRSWPWLWLAPFVAYFMLVVCVPRLRRSMGWLRAGRLSSASVAVTIAIMMLTVLALVLFHTTANPTMSSYRAAIPFDALGGVVMAGVIFSVVNATLEELVFRGVLFDALQSQWGTWGTVAGTALLFGLGHLHGYPSGLVGACLAALFGIALGALRLWTGGLALPIVAHMAADATIYGILVHSGAV